MLFGLTNAPTIFQNTMNEIFWTTWISFVVCLDDIFTYSESLEQHKQYASMVYESLAKNPLYAKLESANFQLLRSVSLVILSAIWVYLEIQKE